MKLKTQPLWMFLKESYWIATLSSTKSSLFITGLKMSRNNWFLKRWLLSPFFSICMQFLQWKGRHYLVESSLNPQNFSHRGWHHMQQERKRRTLLATMQNLTFGSWSKLLMGVGYQWSSYVICVLLRSFATVPSNASSVMKILANLSIKEGLCSLMAALTKSTMIKILRNNLKTFRFVAEDIKKPFLSLLLEAY